MKDQCRKSWFVLIILVCALFCGDLWAASHINLVTDLRVIHHRHLWRLILDGSQPFKYDFFSLRHPSRFVMDIQKAHVVRLYEQHLFYKTPIKDIRIANHHNKRLRIVFDLKHPLKVVVRTQKLLHPVRYQLVLDFLKPNQAIKPHVRPQYFTAFNRHSTVTPKIKHAIHRQLPKHNRRIVIVIDPGHGGKDPGATGLRGTHEKNVVLKIAKYLRRDINHQPGFVAKLTRRADYYLTLRQRLEIARRDKADMFIAIHADAYKNRYAHGASVFALSKRGATSEAARWLAKRENESELMGGVDLADKTHLLKSVLINLSQTATIRASILIGQRIIHALGNVARLHHRHVEQAAFVVLKSPDIPSLLVETGFISNPREELKLANARYEQRIAAAIMRGIRSYFVHSPPRHTWIAHKKFSNRIHKQSYIVRAGDTLTRIAERYNTQLSRLKRINRIHTSAIYVGQKLLIP